MKQLRNIFLLLFLTIKNSSSSTTITTTTTQQHGEDEKKVVCFQNFDIRSYKDLDALNECTIVVGNVNLILGVAPNEDDFSSSEINSRTFPLRL
jgi:hypothetical protein